MIFVDTSFWIALRMHRDAQHDAAVALLRAHAEAPLATTNHVRGETWTFVRRRSGHRSAVHFLDFLELSPRIEVLQIDDELERDALRWLRRHDEREYSVVDATSFAVMRRRRIREALAFDGDFSAAVIRLLRSFSMSRWCTDPLRPPSFQDMGVRVASCCAHGGALLPALPPLGTSQKCSRRLSALELWPRCWAGPLWRRS